MSWPGGVRVGSDLVHVAAVRDTVERFGRRYLDRVFTEGELATCRHGAGWALPRLAARFAAKEAAMKVLRPDAGLSYRRIEVVLDHDGVPALELHGPARDRADQIGLFDCSLSLSHDGDYATAVVVGLLAHRA